MKLASSITFDDYFNLALSFKTKIILVGKFFFCKNIISASSNVLLKFIISVMKNQKKGSDELSTNEQENRIQEVIVVCVSVVLNSWAFDEDRKKWTVLVFTSVTKIMSMKMMYTFVNRPICVFEY